MTKKTFRQWLQTIDDESIREKAIKNTDLELIDESPAHDSMSWVIGSAFTWDSTPEGHDFWAEVSNSYPE